MLKIRLRRMGAKHRPFYRVIVSESDKVTKSAFVESVGHYDPLRTPQVIRLEMERIDHWMGMGAQPSARVKKLMNAFAMREKTGIPEPAAKTEAAPKAEAKPVEKVEEEQEAAPEESPAAPGAEADAAASTEGE